VKRFRIWVLLLLIVLLPVKGAMAAAMLCLPSSGAGIETMAVSHQPAKAVAHESHTHESHVHESPIQASHALASDDGGASPVHPEAAADDCNLCASSCTLTLLAPAPPDLRHPQAGAALLPSSALPVRSFVPDGEERPPRTL
jgi:hypothetical protein